MTAALMGYGSVDVAGTVMPAVEALQRLGIPTLELGPKEGLALINGTQASTALALDALFAGERVFASAIAAGAMSVDALKGSAKPFDPRVSELRGQPARCGSPPRFIACSRAAKYWSAMSPAAGCRILIPSAASRR
jgi:histidine ammonia-lyase